MVVLTAPWPAPTANCAGFLASSVVAMNQPTGPARVGTSGQPPEQIQANDLEGEARNLSFACGTKTLYA